MTPQAQLATLLAMPRAPIPPDRRDAAQIANDMRLEQLAESRELARMEPTSERDAEWLAERCERAWEPRP